tara:strand:- start:1873 stop:2883 length:1011 start_codon:yes stop_codon:yes gene_type:complete
MLNDLEQPQFLPHLAHKIATNRSEIVLMTCTADAASARMCTNTVSRMDALGLARHTLVFTDKAENCDGALARVAPATCAWSSRVLERAPAESVSLKRYFDGRFRFYESKKLYVAQLVRSGLHVLQADADVAWLQNPFPALRRAPSSCALVVQRDLPIANAGMIFARGGRRAGERAMAEVAWRVGMFQKRPGVVKSLVSFPTGRVVYANSDDQTTLNDVIIGLVNGRATFHAQSRYEAKNRHNPSGVADWGTTREARAYSNDLDAARRRMRRELGFQMYEVKDSNETICVAPRHIFAHAGERGCLVHVAGARGATAKQAAIAEAFKTSPPKKIAPPV